VVGEIYGHQTIPARRHQLAHTLNSAAFRPSVLCTQDEYELGLKSIVERGHDGICAQLHVSEWYIHSSCVACVGAGIVWYFRFIGAVEKTGGDAVTFCSTHGR